VRAMSRLRSRVLACVVPSLLETSSVSIEQEPAGCPPQVNDRRLGGGRAEDVVVGEHLGVGEVERRVERGRVQPHLDARVADQRLDDVEAVPDPRGHVDPLLLAPKRDGGAVGLAEGEADPHAVVGSLAQAVEDCRVGLEPRQSCVDQDAERRRRAPEQAGPQVRWDKAAVGVLPDELMGAGFLGGHRVVRWPEVGRFDVEELRHGPLVVRPGDASGADPSLDGLRVHLGGLAERGRVQARGVHRRLKLDVLHDRAPAGSGGRPVLGGTSRSVLRGPDAVPDARRPMDVMRRLSEVPDAISTPLITSASSRSFEADTGVLDAGTHEGLRAALRLVAVQGWDSEAGRAVMHSLTSRCAGWSAKMSRNPGASGGAADPGDVLSLAWLTLDRFARNVAVAEAPWAYLWTAVGRAMAVDAAAAAMLSERIVRRARSDWPVGVNRLGADDVRVGPAAGLDGTAPGLASRGDGDRSPAVAALVRLLAGADRSEVAFWADAVDRALEVMACARR